MPHPNSHAALRALLAELRIVDTHEHLGREEWHASQPADICQDLFLNYIEHELAVAGATKEAIRALLDPAAGHPADRFAAIEPAWRLCRHTGYGDAVRRIATLAYDIDEITPGAIRLAAPQATRWSGPGKRLEILRDHARLDHVQIDYQQHLNPPDHPEHHFFYYDLNLRVLCNAEFDPAALHKDTGIEVRDTASLLATMEFLFEREAPRSIAFKTQHAYDRTLAWSPRTDAEADAVLQRKLRGEALPPAEKDCLGDWCWDHLARLCAEHALPMKHHTGYYARSNEMVTERIRAGLMCPLMLKHPRTKFVLMHIAWPCQEEMLALAKHFENAWVDMCWAWSINPRAAGEFVRRAVHCVPANRLLGFGGDSWRPLASWAYAEQARDGMARALAEEVEDGTLTLADAEELATRWMRGNALELFDREK